MGDSSLLSLSRGQYEIKQLKFLIDIEGSPVLMSLTVDKSVAVYLRGEGLI